MRKSVHAPIAVCLCLLLHVPVLFAQEQAPQRFIEIRPGAATRSQYRKAHYDFCLRELELYERYTADPAELLPAAREFLTRSISRFSGQLESESPLAGQPETLAELGAKAVDELGSSDPILLAHYVDVLLDSGQNDKANQLAEASLKQFESSKYPRGMRLLILLRSKRLAGIVGDAEQVAKTQAAIYQAAPEWFAYATERPHSEHFAWNHYAQAADTFSPSEAKEALDAYGDRSSKDAWLWEMVQGKYHFDLAWHQRGEGTAHTVQPKSWQRYLEEMTLAAEHYRAAYALNPTLPESAAAMIAAAKQGHDLDSTWDWFYRAIAAEADHLPAYNEILQSLRPQWGGSLREMFDFGETCVRTNRFDTDIPYVYILAIYAVHAETQSWSTVFEEPQLYEKATYVLTGLVDHPARAGKNEMSSMQAELLTQNLGLAVHGGEADEAKRLRERLGDRVSQKWLAVFELTDNNNNNKPAP